MVLTFKLLLFLCLVSFSHSQTCRFCQTCGGKFPIDGGLKANEGDYGPWWMFGADCSDDYFASWDQFHFCCSSDPPCIFCESCGGSYPYQVGRRLNQKNYGKWNKYGSLCISPMRRDFI